MDLTGSSVGSLSVPALGVAAGVMAGAVTVMVAAAGAVDTTATTVEEPTGQGVTTATGVGIQAMDLMATVAMVSPAVGVPMAVAMP